MLDVNANESELLKQLVEQVEGAVYASILSNDGLPIATYVKEVSELNPEASAAELTNMVNHGLVAVENFGQIGSFQEIMLISKRMIHLARLVTPRIFLILSITSDGNLGMARLLQRKLASILKERPLFSES
ncbi:MAG: hypothetical protein DRQ10_03700 [Candidatus Hydrothermota bacterium]|nr:MAG: hypothetical protein DRQ10_03700 [Candidatus Hydrothermae bacterium]